VHANIKALPQSQVIRLLRRGKSSRMFANFANKRGTE
jgi:hypothetical protein